MVNIWIIANATDNDHVDFNKYNDTYDNWDDDMMIWWYDIWCVDEDDCSSFKFEDDYFLTILILVPTWQWCWWWWLIKAMINDWLW